MNYNLGKNIRTLRKSKKITQEQLAEVLNTSPQSISRWENNTTYPDVEMIPAIANFFNVTIDSLFENDSEKKLNNIILSENLSDSLIASDNIDAAIDMWRNMLSQYPNDHLCMVKLAQILFKTKIDTDSAKYEIISLCTHVINNCERDSLKSEAKAILCYTYKRSGKLSEAIDLASDMTPFSNSSDIVLCSLLSDKILVSHCKTTLTQNLHIVFYIFFVLTERSHCEKYFSVITLSAMKNMEEIMNIIFDDKNYYPFHADMSKLFKYIAMEYISLKDRQSALNYLDKSCRQAISYCKNQNDCTIKNSIFSGKLSQHLQIKSNRYPSYLCKDLFEELSQAKFISFFKDDIEFTEILKKLAQQF